MANNHGCGAGSGSNGGVSVTEGVVAAEILSRLPVRSLMRFRCVCKSWRDLISDPFFVEKHLDRSRRNPQLLVVPFPVTGGMRSVAFYACTPGPQPRARLLFELKEFPEAQETLEHAQHADGLVLLDTGTGLHACNPSTGEFLALPGSHNVPSPPAAGNGAALGYAARRKRYRVVRCFHRRRDFARETCSLGLEVFELGGGAGSWRAVGSDPPYPIDTSATPASVGGAVYFMVANDLHALPPKGVLAFDLNDEEFKAIDRPPSLSSLNYCVVAELEGELCLFRTSAEGHNLDVWAYRRAEEEGEGVPGSTHTA